MTSNILPGLLMANQELLKIQASLDEGHPWFAAIGFAINHISGLIDSEVTTLEPSEYE